MANMVGNNKTPNGSVGGNIYGNMYGGNDSQNESANNVSSLRDVCNFLQPLMPSVSEGPMAYDHLIELMRGLSLQDDGILLNQKIKHIETNFVHIVHDEQTLGECMEYINEKALEDGDVALKFALIFSSRNFDLLAMKDKKIRDVMLKTLEKNFQKSELYDKNRLYNFITMLGEYYSRVRLANNQPISILGESLMGILLQEVIVGEVISVKLAKTILSQITLNGNLMRQRHKVELTNLLYHIRRHLIEQPNLKPTVKALLLMTLDLFYNNFANLGKQLEEMYTKFLMVEDDDEGNNNIYQHDQQTQSSNSDLNTTSGIQNFETPENSNGTIDSIEVEHSNKKWSELVCEDSFNENSNEIFNENVLNSSAEYHDEQRNEQEFVDRNQRRANRPRNSPRPLKQKQNSNDRNDYQQQSQHVVNEERDESKPLPRWRAPRFNTAEQRDTRRRYSTSFDEDQSSVRSDNIRLYSVNDRLKYSQEKMERSNGMNYNAIANSNWDRQSQHDDRSERSYQSNYERGNYKHGRRGNYNNRQTYDKPPRFQKQEQLQQEQHKNQHQQYRDNKIHSESWRRSNKGNLQNEHGSYQNRNENNESNSRSSSRARTLPRPAKSNYDDVNTHSYRRSHSPNHSNHFPRNQNAHGRNARYSSHSSLASESSNTYERRHNDRQRNFQRRPYHNDRSHDRSQRTEDWSNDTQQRGNSAESEANKNWDEKVDNNELIVNARQTTKYMNYLSSKK